MTPEEIIVERARQAHAALTKLHEDQTRWLRVSSLGHVVAGKHDAGLPGTMGVYTRHADARQVIDDALAAWAEIELARLLG